MKLSFVTLDVFTDTRYAGNPLAIVHLPSEHRTTLTQAQKQSIAKEFNLSETVFMHQASPDAETCDIDIFTTAAEIPFAGHPTIGSAWYLLHYRQQKCIQALQTKAGRIPIALADSLISAQIPHNIHIHTHTFTSPLNAEPNPIVSIVKKMSFILVRLPDLEALAKAKASLHADTYDPSILDDGWKEGLVGTLFYAPQGTDAAGNRAFRTRMHAGIEDPATGSASSALGAYLALNEPAEGGYGPFKYVLTQGVEMGRKSDIVVEVVRRGADAIESIFLSGEAVKVMEGSLEI
jgi:PhzF family phenazine biosynthesis protein